MEKETYPQFPLQLTCVPCSVMSPVPSGRLGQVKLKLRLSQHSQQGTFNVFIFGCLEPEGHLGSLLCSEDPLLLRKPILNGNNSIDFPLGEMSASDFGGPVAASCQLLNLRGKQASSNICQASLLLSGWISSLF